MTPWDATSARAARVIGRARGPKGVVYPSILVEPMGRTEDVGSPRGFDEDATAWLKEIEFDRKLRE